MKNKSGFCGSIHGKSFEILLIILFTLGIIMLTVNLIVTEWYFRDSSSLFIIEICLVALNGLCLILTIILRYWRSNGSVLNTNYTSSHWVSIIEIFLIIINLLGSIIEGILFFFIYYIISYDPDKEITEFYTKVAEINVKLMDKVDHNSKIFTYDEDTLKKKSSVLKTLPWISFSLNTFCQILSLVFIILLIKRIKHKSDYGIATDAMTQNGSALPNGSSSNRNAVYLENSNNQVYQEEKRKSKKSKKKVKKNERSARKEVFSNAESDQIEINKKSRKKKSRKKRSKSKDKKK
jgi:hypothetical protein